MNIKIELEDPKRCDGCPLLKRVENTSYCHLYSLPIYRNKDKPMSWSFRHDRPAKCIEENGEGGGDRQ